MVKTKVKDRVKSKGVTPDASDELVKAVATVGATWEELYPKLTKLGYRSIGGRGPTRYINEKTKRAISLWINRYNRIYRVKGPYPFDVSAAWLNPDKCRRMRLHLTAVDSDGYCDYCGHQE